MAQRAIGDQWDGNGDVEEGEAVEEEVARVGRAVDSGILLAKAARRSYW